MVMGRNNIYSLPTLEATRSIFRASLGPSPDQNAALSEAELDHSVHAGSINYDRSIKFERTNTSPEDKRTENLAFRSAHMLYFEPSSTQESALALAKAR